MKLGIVVSYFLRYFFGFLQIKSFYFILYFFDFFEYQFEYHFR